MPKFNFDSLIEKKEVSKPIVAIPEAKKTEVNAVKTITTEDIELDPELFRAFYKNTTKESERHDTFITWDKFIEFLQNNKPVKFGKKFVIRSK